MNSNPDDDRKLQESLQRSVTRTLERKRRLGQYAVVWRDGRPVRLEPDKKGYRVQEIDEPVPYRSNNEQGTSQQDKP